VDTGIAGIHAGGVAFRMDDVPLPLRPPLSGPLDPATVLAALAARVRA
jgi:formylmethanofuran dehydrogenase subunit B